MGAKAPKVQEAQGPSQESLDAQAEAERAAKDRATNANKEVQSQSQAAYGRRTGRRLLLAPGREGQLASTLGGGN